jgi:signal transduction histidine kinase
VSERVEAEEELMAAQRLLADARETERLRIAQELHDSVVQDLLGLRYQLSAVATGVRAGGAPDEAAASLQGVEDQLATTVSRIRDLIAELRPTGLDEAGLVGALENLAADARSGDTQVTLDIDPGARELARPTALCLFRVAQEAVRNALQHADPRHVTVRLRLRPRAIVLRVSDDGRGFVVPDHLGTLTRDNHFGLVGMAERVGQAGGRLRLRSRPGRGTSVTAWLPPVTLDDARGSHNDTD